MKYKRELPVTDLVDAVRGSYRTTVSSLSADSILCSVRTWQNEREMIRNLDQGRHVFEEVTWMHRMTAFLPPETL